jgi:hypothetical protein
VTNEQQFFEQVAGIGEWLSGKVHIMDVSDAADCDDDLEEQAFRIYTFEGHCICSHRRFYGAKSMHYTNSGGFRYYFSNDGSGFKPISVEEAILFVDRFFPPKKKR